MTSPQGKLAGRTAFVTGASSGLGRAIAEHFTAEGAQVIIADIDDDAGRELAARLGQTYVHLDVSSEADWLAVLAPHARIDILVNNAGITTVGSVEDLSLEAFRHEFAVDVDGVFLGCKHIIPKMREHGGSVINMSSLCGVRAQADLTAYNGAKAAVTHMTKSIALHYARKGYGIRCNSVHPGVIQTEMLEKTMAQVPDPDAMYQGWVNSHPIGRLGRPEEVAALVLYLASDDAGFITGAEFRIDGGSSI